MEKPTGRAVCLSDQQIRRGCRTLKVMFVGRGRAGRPCCKWSTVESMFPNIRHQQSTTDKRNLCDTFSHRSSEICPTHQ